MQFVLESGITEQNALRRRELIWEPGTVLAIDDEGGGGITIACGRDALRCTVLQRPGSKRLPAGEFQRGFPVSVGERFATPG